MVKVFVILGAVLLVLAALAFIFVNPILGAFPLIFGATLLAIAWVARDWEDHPNFQQREAVRARKRAEKFERTAGARARDRERWEAHQAKKARKAAGEQEPGR